MLWKILINTRFNKKPIIINSQLLKLLYDFEGFNYYYFQHLLSDLIEQKYIINYKQEEEWLYVVSEEGQNILELTEILRRRNSLNFN